MKKRFWLIIGIVTGLLAIALIALLGARAFLYEKKSLPFSAAPLSNIMQEKTMPEQVFEQPDRDVMLNTTLSLLSDKNNPNPYVASWYMLSGDLSSQPALRSEIYLCSDQILLAGSYVTAGKKKEAKEILDSIYEDYLLPTGGLQIYITAKEQDFSPELLTDERYDRIPETLSPSGLGLYYLDVYLRYYARWGTKEIWDDIGEKASILCPPGRILEDILPFSQEEEFALPVAQVQPEVIFPEEGDRRIADLDGIGLPSLMPETLRVLVFFDEGYQIDYEKTQTILENAVISEDVPLYAAFYDLNNGTYVYFYGDSFSARTLDSLQVMLSLAKEGKLGREQDRWLKEQMHSMFGIMESYDIISGQSSGTREDVQAYGLILQIARYLGDDTLFSQAYDRLKMHLATASGSPVRGAIFQTVSDQRVLVRAADNLYAVTGVGK